MTFLRRRASFAIACGIAIASVVARADNLLINGDFEAPEIIPGWTLVESVSGQPQLNVNSADIVNFANNPTPGGLGLWMRSFAGDTTPGLDNDAVNAHLSQSVAGVAGETYSLLGDALFEDFYSGGVSTLSSTSPSGAVPSPTKNTFELAFLDASGSVIGSPATLDVGLQVSNGGGYTSLSPLTATAPPGTASVRVTASATDMVFNRDPGQSAFYDNFSLTTLGAPSVELLVNGDLNNVSDQIEGYTVMEPLGINSLELADFANNTPGGSQSLWLRAFTEGDGSISQSVPGFAGGEYTFSLFSLFEENFSGGDPSQPTEVLMELAFRDSGGATLLTETLDIATAQSNGAGYSEQSVSSVAPVGTSEVVVSLVVTDPVFTSPLFPTAFFDDFSLVVTIPEPSTVTLTATLLFLRDPRRRIR